MKKILAVNPGSTSTKIAVFHDETLILNTTIRHSVEELSPFPRAIDQLDYRTNLVLKTLEDNHIPFDFDSVVGRGGLLRPIPGGVYQVNEEMVYDLFNAKRDHACNLGALIAYNLAREIKNCPAFMADPGVVDELNEYARITGSPLMPRITTWHALNQRAIGRRYARDISKRTGNKVKYEEMNLIICHLGGGISVGAHTGGLCVDVNNALDGEGPFSPERAGTLPSGALIDLCYSGRYTQHELKKRISGKAGLAAHLGTVSVQEIEARIDQGDEHAKLILDAMIYQIAKAIGALTPVLYGKIDAILLTGGIAHSNYVTSMLTKRIEHIAPVAVYPGEDELQALALNALGALAGEMPVNTYHSLNVEPWELESAHYN